MTLTSEIADFEPEHQKELDEFVICFDGPSKSVIRDDSKPLGMAVVAAASLGLETLVGVKRLSGAIVFFRDDGKPVHAYSFSAGTASVLVSRPVPTGSLEA